MRVESNGKHTEFMNLRKLRRGKEGETAVFLKVNREQQSMRPVSGEDPGLFLTESPGDESLSRGNSPRIDPVPRAQIPRKPDVQANLGLGLGNISVETGWTKSVFVGGWLIYVPISLLIFKIEFA